MAFKDHFSKQASAYAKFRPRYPRKMFEYLAGIAPGRDLAWDCATGSGQAAVELAEFFIHVIATDASEQQVANAEQHERVEYRVAPAEVSGLAEVSVDLVMVAQALHWFDLPRFYEELRRVLKANAVFAASTYKLFQITPQIDAIVNETYWNLIKPFWPTEIAHVAKFEELAFPFSEIETPAFQMTAAWSLDELVGYLRSWSATQRFNAANGRDPIEEIREELSAAWGEHEKVRQVVWPLTLRAAINA